MLQNEMKGDFKKTDYTFPIPQSHADFVEF